MLCKLYASFARRHIGKSTRRARAFAQFRAGRGQSLRRHAIHEALEEFHAKRWAQWPDEHRDPASAAVHDFANEHADEVALHEYLQWQADLQLAGAQARAREAGMAVGLYADLAISISRGRPVAPPSPGVIVLGDCRRVPPPQVQPQGQGYGTSPRYHLRPLNPI